MKPGKPSWRTRVPIVGEWSVYVMFAGLLWYGVLSQDFLAKDEVFATLLVTLGIGFSWGFSTKGKR